MSARDDYPAQDGASYDPAMDEIDRLRVELAAARTVIRILVHRATPSDYQSTTARQRYYAERHLWVWSRDEWAAVRAALTDQAEETK